MNRPDDGTIRIGIGGWTYEPWRGAFYPSKFPQKRELEYASTKLTSIEINGTYYGAQKPETFAKWHDETPQTFVFSVKAPRYATNRKVLADAGKMIERFFAGGVMELKEKLGPINWQFMPTKVFDPADFGAFLRLLPRRVRDQELRHVVEVRHESFRSPEFLAMAQEYGVAIVTAADSKYPRFDDVTAPFVYARIMGTQETEPSGYSAAGLGLWSEWARTRASGCKTGGQKSHEQSHLDAKPCDVYLYVISGHKVSNPAAAMALIERIREPRS